MSDTPVATKKKNHKKKKAAKNKSATVPPEAAAAPDTDNNDQAYNLSEILPQKVGWTTKINEMEVTMTQSNTETATLKKKKSKKKKKKAEQKTSESAEEPAKEENENSPNLLNFAKSGGITLVNFPEISVTVNDVPKQTNVEKANKVEQVEKEQKQTSADVNADTASAPKKKKKKKKKASVTAAESEPSPPPNAAEEEAQTSPTYIKLPATGDTCVLVVSHESFAANGNVPDKSKVPADNAVSVVDTVQSNSNKPITSVPVLTSKAGDSGTLIPISLSEVISNAAQGIPMDQNNTSSVSLTPIANVGEPVANEENNDSGEPKLSKAQLKAERRAKQEAQRAAKMAKTGEKSSVDKPVATIPAKNISDTKEIAVSKNAPAKTPDTKVVKDSSKLVVSKEHPHQMRLFSHLPQYKTLDVLLKNISKAGNKIHPAVLDIGTQFAHGTVCGSNARCIALLAAFKEVIRDHTKPAEKDFLKDLDCKLQFYMSFLQNCRPPSVSMVNAMKFLKHQINHINKELVNDADIKNELCGFIDRFVREEILLAKEQIGTCAADKIVDGDVILVFAYSSLVKEVLCKAFGQNKKFRAVVVDSRPKKEALKMLNCLVEEGISCSYTLINGISYAMKEVSKVIIGAHALLSNGYVMSRMGCSQIALVAASYSVPVLVCCETYKFWERVLTDSFVHNELGDPDVLIKSGRENQILKGYQDLQSLQSLNLLYDVTPPDLISVVITEKGVLPCTSVPVVLRVRHAGLHE